MNERKKAFTRRDFMKASACLVAGGMMGARLFDASAAGAFEKSTVVLVRDPDVLGGNGSIVAEVLERMLDQAVTALMKSPDPHSAWQRLVKPGDVVGIKSNSWSPLPTPPSLESAIRKRLRKAGIRDEDIAADDRGVLKNAVFLRSTALINVRPMRTHIWSGLGTLIKNYIMFTPDPSQYHPNACENLGSLWHLPQTKGKTRLNILVMLTPLFHAAGPHHFSRQYLWNYCGLIVSTDPVAADSTGAGIIQSKRNAFFGAEKPISPPPMHIAAADAKFGLGNCRPERIDTIRIGYDKDILI